MDIENTIEASKEPMNSPNGQMKLSNHLMEGMWE